MSSDEKNRPPTETKHGVVRVRARIRAQMPIRIECLRVFVDLGIVHEVPSRDSVSD